MNSLLLTIAAHRKLIWGISIYYFTKRAGTLILKKRMMMRTVTIFYVTFLFASSLFAQDITKEDLRIPDAETVQIIETYDGSKIIGRITEISDNEVQFESSLGTITVLISKIKKILEVSSSTIKNGEYWPPNPNATRLFFAPTGRMLEKGKGYFSDYYLFFPGASVGITDNITIGGGMSLFPGVDLDSQLFYFTPKIGIKAEDNINIAAGALLIKVPGEEDNPTVGIAYGVGTFGSEEASFTAGFGYGFVDQDFAKKPMIMLGGEKRMTKRTAFVTENWIIPGLDGALISYGVRFMGEHMSVDLALINITEESIFPGVPYLDFVFNF